MKKVYGIGINDSVEPVSVKINGVVIICPFYSKWKQMLQRVSKTKGCYSEITVSDEWRYFSKFKSWVQSQPNKNWQNCDLDKDLLDSSDLMCYSENTCCFLNKLVNNFISVRNSGKFMRGIISYSNNKFIVRCRNPITNKSDSLGRFQTELEAHKTWQAKKHEYACQLAELQDDPKVAQALRERYAPDKDWTNK